MAKRESPAAASKRTAEPKPGTKGSRQTPAQKRAAEANLAKGRAARRKQQAEQEAREAAGEVRVTASERWARLLDGTLTVQDLDNDELARMQVRSADGSFAGRRRAVPSHIAQAMQREGIKRATEMFRVAAPRAVKRLIEIAEDPETKDADAIRAMDILLNRGLGKQPETVLIEEKSKWEDAQEAGFGVQREEMSD